MVCAVTWGRICAPDGAVAGLYDVGKASALDIKSDYEKSRRSKVCFSLLFVKKVTQ